MNFTPDPVAFTIFGIDVRWYAVLICAGILLAGFIGMRRAPSHGISQDDALDIILVSVPVGIVGARLWYVLFNWEYYHSFFDVINIRAGGLAIHGGLIFGAVAAILMCRKKKCNPLDVLDFAFPCIALAQAIGRWGNFFNQEAHGSPTDLPWAIVVDGQKVHPTFLYESLWCLMLFFVLSAVDKRRRFKGETVMLYGVLYSFERFFVEQLRTDSLLTGPKELVTGLIDGGYDPTRVEGVLHLGDFLIFPFKTAQFVSLVAFVVCLAGLIVMNKRIKRRKEMTAAGEEDPAVREGRVATGEEYSAVREGRAAAGEEDPAVREGRIAAGEEDFAVREGRIAAGEEDSAVGGIRIAGGEEAVSDMSADDEKAPSDRVRAQEGAVGRNE